MDSNEFLEVSVKTEYIEQDDEEEYATNRPKRKRKWQRDCLSEQEIFSSEELCLKQESTEQNELNNYIGIDEDAFSDLLARISHLIQKKDTPMREAISAKSRLEVTLRFLATGDSYENLKSLTSISPQAIGKIVIETCEAIIEGLNDYIKLPTTSNEWKEIAAEFERKSGFSHCLGAIDGKHITIKKPPNSGSFYFNSNKSFSIILLAVVNANCEFIYADAGINGKASDEEAFLISGLCKKIEEGNLNLPMPEPVGDDPYLPYVFVADDAFALGENLMEPYAHLVRLSSAGVELENAFDILTSRFRVLLTTMNLRPEKATTVTLACCYLHNYLRGPREQICLENQSAPAPRQIKKSLVKRQGASARKACHKAKKKVKNDSSGQLRKLPIVKQLTEKESGTTKEMDEAEIFAKSWAYSYNLLSERQKLFAKKAIDNILIYGQLRQLTYHSVAAPVSSFSSRSLTPSSGTTSVSSAARLMTPVASLPVRGHSNADCNSYQDSHT